jgi:hypothetical protein
MARGKRAGAPAPGAKNAVRPDIKEALGKALLNRAKELGVGSVTGLGMEDRPAETAPKPGTQGFLFGEGDKVRAALSSELVIINAEIGGAEKRMLGIKEIISCLSDRRRIVEDAMLALDKIKDKKKKKPAAEPEKAKPAAAEKPKPKKSEKKS